MTPYCDGCGMPCGGACWGMPNSCTSCRNAGRCPVPEACRVEPEPIGTGLPIALLVLGVVFLAVGAAAAVIAWSLS